MDNPVNKNIINSIEIIIKKYLRNICFDRQAYVLSVTGDMVTVQIDNHGYTVKNGTAIPFSPGDKCLVHFIDGDDNKKIIIARL